MAEKKSLYPEVGLQCGDKVFVSPSNHYNLIDDHKAKISYIEFVEEFPYYIALNVHFLDFLDKECYVKRTGITKADLFCGKVRIRRDEGPDTFTPFLGCSDSVIYEVTKKTDQEYNEQMAQEEEANML